MPTVNRGAVQNRGCGNDGCEGKRHVLDIMAVRRYRDGRTAKTTRDGTAAAVLGDPTKKKAKNAQATADEALDQAGQTAQHFWNKNGTGEDAGAHVTEYPQKEWTDPNHENYHKGANILFRSNSIKIRNGLIDLAEFTGEAVLFRDANGVVIAQFGAAAIIGDIHGEHIKISHENHESRFAFNGWATADDAEMEGPYITGDTSGMMRFETPWNVAYAYMFGVPYDEEEQTGGDIACIDNGMMWSSGSVLGDNQANFGGMNEGLFATETYVLTLQSGDLADGGHAEYSETVRKKGYYPLCVSGFHSNKQRTTVRSCYISSRSQYYDDSWSEDSCTLNIHVRNDSGGNATGPITADIYVLWLKTTPDGTSLFPEDSDDDEE